MNIKRFPLGALWTNCYIIWDENKDGFIVDPGGSADEVRDFVALNGIKVHLILLTHGHTDHIGGVCDVRDLAKCGVAVHVEDADCLTNADRNLSSIFDVPFTIKEAEKLLSDGDVLEIGTLKLKVIHTPGHTPGGICVVVSDADESVLISGDTLFARSVGRSDLPGGDEDTLYDSLKRLVGLPKDMRVLPGHGAETTIGTEERFNPYWPR
ncbi:MAG: MBL fold metallo-hydrolase [Synergistes sp.]|nr:MBL fold metallo-hydrolase [Synergistes sp.]